MGKKRLLGRVSASALLVGVDGGGICKSSKDYSRRFYKTCQTSIAKLLFISKPMSSIKLKIFSKSLLTHFPSFCLGKWSI